MYRVADAHRQGQLSDRLSVSTIPETEHKAAIHAWCLRLMSSNKYGMRRIRLPRAPLRRETIFTGSHAEATAIKLGNPRIDFCTTLFGAKYISSRNQAMERLGCILQREGVLWPCVRELVEDYRGQSSAETSEYFLKPNSIRLHRGWAVVGMRHPQVQPDEPYEVLDAYLFESRRQVEIAKCSTI